MLEPVCWHCKLDNIFSNLRSKISIEWIQVGTFYLKIIYNNICFLPQQLLLMPPINNYFLLKKSGYQDLVLKDINNTWNGKLISSCQKWTDWLYPPNTPTISLRNPTNCGDNYNPVGETRSHHAIFVFLIE